MPFSPLPDDYAERVYAGVVGKTIGVYLGRPFEGWPYERLKARFGVVDRYVHEDLGAPLVVADDDLSGTFTFLRALEDHGFDPGLTSRQIGETWLNYLIEGRTVLWWGGMGASTEHTAYLRLKAGIPAPDSGSAALNTPVVAEQIGAQIFIEGWGWIHPNDPASAADFARRAALVSHDGAAVDGAVVVAAMSAAAFGGGSVDRLLDLAVAQIPAHGGIARLIGDVREWHAAGLDWEAGFARIQEKYGYDRYGGGCHMVPNHAIVVHALLHSGGDFTQGQVVANTCGWDTDCNAANVGAILGVLGGLSGIEDRWREPFRDRLLIPTADGGRCVTDCVREADAVVRTALRLRGLDAPVLPRFRFPYPGAVQGFDRGPSLRAGETMETPVFPTPAERAAGGYSVVASPTLYPAQTLVGEWEGEGTLFVRDAVGAVHDVAGAVPDVPVPLSSVGFRATTDARLVSLDWSGVPSVFLPRTSGWVDGTDTHSLGWEGMRVVQNRGTGLAIHGSREWRDVEVSSEIQVGLAEAAGVAVRVQGMRRWTALVVSPRDGLARLVRAFDGADEELARARIERAPTYALRLRAVGTRLEGWVGDVPLFAENVLLTEGAIALVVCEGRLETPGVAVRPA